MKKTLTIILIVLFLFSFGCAKKDKEQPGKTTGKSFSFTGTNGIIVSFEEDAPPHINFRDEPIEIMLEVINRGSADLGSGEINAKLKGVAATDIFKPTTTETSNKEELLRAELDPSVTTIDLGEITYSPEEMFSQEYNPKIEAEICFPYFTQVDADNFWISDKQDSLDAGKISSSDNSDAPVHVSNLEEFKGTGKARFQFTVANVGGGKIVDSCFPKEEDKEKVKVRILEPGGISCETLGGGSSGEITLGETGKKIVRCSVDVPRGENYKTPLIIGLEYNYDLELSKTIIVKNTELLAEPQ